MKRNSDNNRQIPKRARQHSVKETLKKIPVLYVRRNNITKRLQCREEGQENVGNDDNEVLPSLIKFCLTQKVIDVVKHINVWNNWR